MRISAPGKRNLTAAVTAVLGLFLLAAGCRSKKEAPSAPAASSRPAPTVVEQPRDEAYAESGDLAALKKRGQLRILAQRRAESYLPREGYPPDLERELAAEFVSGLGLEPAMVYVESFKDLIPALLAGQGDVVADNLAITAERKKLVSFTEPLEFVREQVVGRPEEKKVSSFSELSGRTIAVQEGTSFVETLALLRKKHPGIRIEFLPGRLTSDDILDRLAAREIDLTVDDSNVLEVALQYRSDVKPLIDLPGERSLAWAVRPDNPELLKALNEFILEERNILRYEPVRFEDLPGLKKRRSIRMVTRNHPFTYFLWQGELYGFEYELAREFAQRQGLRLEVSVARTPAELFSRLREGKGDFIAALLVADRDRPPEGLAFSRPYHLSDQVVITRAVDDRLQRPADLAGRTVVIPSWSPALPVLEGLRAGGIGLTIQEAPGSLDVPELIAQVASGEADLTVAGLDLVDLQRAFGTEIKVAFTLLTGAPHCWVVRSGSPKLLQAINQFLEKEYRGAFYNTLFKRYFQEIKKAPEEAVEEYRRTNIGEKISPYDDIVRRFAKEYGFFWRLIVSQMYQESRFNPQARSWSGAVGLMQVLPSTARQFGFKDLEDPMIGIHAGVKYLDWLRGRFEPELDAFNRVFFSLAAYNAGIGHVADARRLAKGMGWDASRWFGHVEKAMLLLAKSEYADKARYGYVQGKQPVEYVRQVVDRYQKYASFAAQTAPLPPR